MSYYEPTNSCLDFITESNNKFVAFNRIRSEIFKH